MTKKFDVVIGNPPYQMDRNGNSTKQMPIYHHFMEAAYEISEKAVLITPARFLFDAGYTPKAWNKKMLEDSHLSVEQYVPNSDELFPGTDIKGGVAVTLRDTSREVEAIGLFTKFPELNGILRKLADKKIISIATSMTSSRSFRYTEKMHEDYPEAKKTMLKGDYYKLTTKTFEQLPFLYSAECPQDENNYYKVLGLVGGNRTTRWIHRDYFSGPEALHKFKVAVPKASGSGMFGETLAPPAILSPETGVAGTFITIGSFDTEGEAQACLAYIRTKFARAMLGVMKITQDNSARVWKYVPMQDFSLNSDIDWTMKISEIDQELYKKYGLNSDEIKFVETKVKAMN